MLFDPIVGKVFLDEVDLLHAELAPLEIIEKPRVGGKVEDEPVGVQSLTLFAIALVEALAAVLAVAQQRPARVGHLRADLMGSPGKQPAFYQRERAGGAKRAVFRDGAAGAGLAFLFYVNLIAACILEQEVFQPAARGFGAALHGTEIVLFDLAAADLFIEDAQRLGVLRRDDDTAGIAVDAVAERGSKGVFLARPPLALPGEIGLDVGDERVVVPGARAVAQNARLLVGEKNVFILVDDGETRRADLEIGVILSELLKKLVADIQLKNVSLAQTGIAPGAFAVELDALETDVFLQQRLRQQGNGFSDKSIEPLACVVAFDSKLFHGMPVRK